MELMIKRGNCLLEHACYERTDVHEEQTDWHVRPICSGSARRETRRSFLMSRKCAAKFEHAHVHIKRTKRPTMYECPCVAHHATQTTDRSGGTEAGYAVQLPLSVEKSDGLRTRQPTDAGYCLCCSYYIVGLRRCLITTAAQTGPAATQR